MDIANPSEEHAMLRSMIRDWVEEYVEPQAFEHDKKELFNLDLLKSMGELGLLGISAPEEYGGAGLDAAACAIVHEELSASDPGFALAYLAHSMLFVNNLAYNGNEEQKTRILPKVCSGEWIGAMAMSEPDAGTDVLGLATNAEQQPDGSWKLNGRKMWITNGCLDETGTPADVVWVYARTGTDEKGRVQLSTFLVEAGTPGYSVGQKIYDKTGMRASNTAELVFDDCIVPANNLVGEPGESHMIHMMCNLEIELLASRSGILFPTTYWQLGAHTFTMSNLTLEVIALIQTMFRLNRREIEPVWENTDRNVYGVIQIEIWHNQIHQKNIGDLQKHPESIND